MSDKFDRLIVLAELLVRQQQKEADLKAELAEVTKARKATEMEELPTLMAEIGPGISEIKLGNGYTVTLSQDVQCGITAARSDAALAWLRNNDFGGLIKTTVTAEFGKEEDNEALALYADLESHYGAVTKKQGVHASTLKAFVKEQLEKGAPLPMDLFGVHPFNIAKVTK